MPVRVLTPVFDATGKMVLKVSPEPRPSPPRGLTPPRFSNKNHYERSLKQLSTKQTNLEKYIFLTQLKDADVDLFYKVVMQNMTEVVPILYTPTVGEACLNYSHIYRRPDGIFISIEDKGHIKSILQNWPRKDEARISVVTDGSRILGLGDLGVNGMPISQGKLSLYVAAAGIRSSSTLPICLDLGTNNPKYLEDPLYLGRPERRVGREEMTEFMDEFMSAMRDVFPHLLVQFEDFSTDNAFYYLERYRHSHLCFNDDISGTGAVVLSGFLNAAKISSAASGLPLTDHRILFFGAGSAGVGVAMQLVSFFVLQGLTEEEAKARIWTVDSQGLITNQRSSMAEHKRYFARNDYQGPPLKNLVDIIDYVRPTALMGLSTIGGAFTQEVVEAMQAINPRPIIFPLSNPLTMCELKFEDAVEWTDGNVIFASGSPYQPLEHNGILMEPGQGNNMYIFPGLGLGSLLARAEVVTDGMIEAASLALADSLTDEERQAGLLYPRISRIRDISAEVAASVVRSAQDSAVDRADALRTMNDEQLLTFVKNKMWKP